MNGQISNREDAEKVSDALRELLAGIGREAGLHKMAPAAAAFAEVPPSPTGSRCLMTRAALDMIRAREGRVPFVTVLHAAQYTTVTGFGAWVEWLGSITPVALTAFYTEQDDTLTIALWTEVREQILAAVSAYHETMADYDFTRESI